MEVLGMVIQSSRASKAHIREYVKIEELSNKIQGTLFNHLLTMHNLSERAKEQSLQRLSQLGLWLIRNGSMQGFHCALLCFFHGPEIVNK